MRCGTSRRRTVVGALAALATIASSLTVSLPQVYADPPSGPNPAPALVPKPVSWTGGTGSLTLTMDVRARTAPGRLSAVSSGRHGFHPVLQGLRG